MHINWAHVHLMINHFPVIGVLGGILLLIYALVRKSEEVKMVSFGVFVLIALITIPVFLTGEGAEEVVKHIPGVTETYIGRHEELAELTLVLMEILGVLSLAGLVLLKLRGAIPIIIVILVLVMSLITATFVGITANLGGQIRHTEIRDPAVPAQELQPAK
ncbi:MAG TPA: hypothetical protein VL122_02985 [Nitrospirota bacterium]|nr:hypothetical protein [Nitrospirota bacterium]